MERLEPWQVIVIGVAVLLVIGAVAWAIYTQQRSKRLRQHFGPEYERVVSETGSNRRADAVLAQREARVRKLNIRPLLAGERDAYEAQWRMCQAQFVDNPASAVLHADRLIRDIMSTRGYPVGNDDDLMDDISAAYPMHTDDYRRARYVVGEYGRGQASTEDLRKALVHYRALFDELLGREEELRRAS